MNIQEKPSVREAKIEDAPEISNVHVNSWRETYSDHMPNSIIENLPLSFKRRMSWWRECISAPKNNRKIWVAETQKHGIIGFSSVESARDKRFQGSGELTCIYLLKAYHHQGIGYLLLREATSYLSRCGFKSMYCWIFKENPTINFYKKCGAEVTNIEKSEKLGATEIHEEALIWKSL